MGKLTKTERAVAELYFKQGLRPREIATKLGISINTVYKAISKARSLSKAQGNAVNGGDKAHGPAPTGLMYSVNLTVTISPQPMVSGPHGELGQLIRELRELKEQLVNLASRLSGLGTMGCLGTGDLGGEVSEAPEFLRDNVWVDVIRSRFS